MRSSEQKHGAQEDNWRIAIVGSRSVTDAGRGPLGGFLHQAFEHPGQKFVTIHQREDAADGTKFFPFLEYSPTIDRFIAGLYERGVMMQFDWMAWEKTRGDNLFERPALIAEAPAVDCIKLITMCVRAERFGDGWIAKALETGVITGCLRRLAELYAIKAPAHEQGI